MSSEGKEEEKDIEEVDIIKAGKLLSPSSRVKINLVQTSLYKTID